MWSHVIRARAIARIHGRLYSPYGLTAWPARPGARLQRVTVFTRRDT